MTPPWRQIIREQLEMLASEANQLAYQEKVSNVDVTKELIEGWFSDSYHPGSADFRSCFTASELRALAQFDANYEARRKLLPPTNGSVQSWLASELWREVVREAFKTLALFEANPPLQPTAYGGV